MKYHIQFSGTGTPKEVLDALSNLTDGLRASLDNVGKLKGQMPTGKIGGKQFEALITTASCIERAQKVALYYEKYHAHLRDNNLNDDSDTISVGELFDFVENEILPNEDDF